MMLWSHDSISLSAIYVQICTVLNMEVTFFILQGFRYFATHLRGREEMICSVINEPSVCHLSVFLYVYYFEFDACMQA